MQDPKLTKFDLRFLRKNLAQAIAEVDVLYAAVKGGQPLAMKKYPKKIKKIKQSLDAIKEVLEKEETPKREEKPARISPAQYMEQMEGIRKFREAGYLCGGVNQVAPSFFSILLDGGEEDRTV